MLASGSCDGHVKLWDVECGAPISDHHTGRSSDFLGDPITCCDWNFQGTILGVAGRDGDVHVIDPRSPSHPLRIDAHAGRRVTRCCWTDGMCGLDHRVASSGFDSTNRRSICLWDIRACGASIDVQTFDAGAGVMGLHWDETSGILFGTALGDRTMRYFHLDTGRLSSLGGYRVEHPIKSMVAAPKRISCAWYCDIQSFYAVVDSQIGTLIIGTQKKNKMIFHSDLFPPCYAGIPAATIEEWKSSKPFAIPRVSQNPQDPPPLNDSISSPMVGTSLDIPPPHRWGTGYDMSSNASVCESHHKEDTPIPPALSDDIVNYKHEALPLWEVKLRDVPKPSRSQRYRLQSNMDSGFAGTDRAYDTPPPPMLSPPPVTAPPVIPLMAPPSTSVRERQRVKYDDATVDMMYMLQRVTDTEYRIMKLSADLKDTQDHVGYPGGRRMKFCGYH
eukprot:GHVO01039631.1.p1 GENE.GHVO01039631.1~~GHVO01039631.1.p1  ORF type:complete len:445 (-),score=116.01 GHVO01039631.1:803-2137(-)